MLPDSALGSVYRKSATPSGHADLYVICRVSLLSRFALESGGVFFVVVVVVCFFVVVFFFLFVFAFVFGFLGFFGLFVFLAKLVD